MLDPTDLFDLPKSILVGILRALWWLAWDFCVETIGWSIGWVALRVVTIDRFPKEALGGLDQANGFVASFVEVVGLVILATTIWLLSGLWP
ncbi:hypothetical protein EV700_2264 [Fluviicoccus keumensis]|uniref:Uncharacterized protein n=1 Tax=Fluviicoccus keumensis TaxID=1435465 RepID=A0A4Q7YMY2_9GAMM|nr:hypothetical protein [Fluviicoccus keumensis]RZU38334.1 hypothetical protein EV700_2264 [Fluviicoccus keumensis]